MDTIDRFNAARERWQAANKALDGIKADATEEEMNALLTEETEAWKAYDAAKNEP